MECRNIFKKKIRMFVYSIGFYILLLPFDCFRVGSIGSLLKVYSIVPVLFLVFSCKNKKIKYNKLFFLMILYLIFTLLSCIYSIDIEESFYAFFSLGLNIIFVIVLGSLSNYTDYEKKFLLKCFIASSWVMFFCFFIFGDKNSLSGRLTLSFREGSSQDANYVNGYILFAFSYHISRLINKKVFHILPVSLLLIFVVLTGSRGAMLAFVSCIFFAIVLAIHKSRYKFKIILVSIVLIFLFIVFFSLGIEYISPELAMRFSGEYISEHGTTGRMDIWMNLLQKFIEANFFREIMGWGYGTTRLLNTTVGISTAGLVAHNLYIDNLISIGVIGLLLQILMQIECMKILLKSKNEMLICSFGAFMIMCLSLSLVNYKPIWGVMLMALILKNNRNGRYIKNKLQKI